MKSLFAIRILVVAIIVPCFAAILMASEPNQATPDKKQVTNPKSPLATPAVENNGHESKAHPSETHSDSPHWYAAIERSEWWLVVAAFLTLAVIWYQAREMARATNEMRESTRAIREQVGVMERQTKATETAAENTEKSVRLQEVALRQWVDIEKWRAVPWIPEGGVLSLNIQFDVVNPTSLPLTLYSVSIGFSGMGGAIAQRNLLPPKNRQTIAMPIKITEEQLLRWKQDKIGFYVNGKVIYEDILQEVRTQPFEGMISLSEKNGAVFMRYLGPGLHIAEKDGN